MPSVTRRRLLAGAGGSSALVFAGLLASIDGRGPSETDWPMAQYDPAGTSYNPHVAGPKSDVEVVWETETPSWFTVVNRSIHPPILIGDRLVHADGGLAAYDAETGKRQFAMSGPYETPLARAPASAYRTDTLVVGGDNGIIGLNGGGGLSVPFGGQVGTDRWRIGDGRSRATPVVADGSVFMVLRDQERLARLDPNSGATEWTQPVRVPPTIDSGPLLAPNKIPRPAVRDGVVYVDRYTTTAAYDAETGEQRWQQLVDVSSGTYGPTATTEGLLVSSVEMVLLGPGDGSVTQLDSASKVGPPAVADGTAFWKDIVGVRAVDLVTGETQWVNGDVPIQYARSRGPPAVADGVVYVSTGGAVVGLDAATGEILFEHTIGDTLSPPIVSEGRLYVIAPERVIALGGEQ